MGQSTSKLIREEYLVDIKGFVQKAIKVDPFEMKSSRRQKPDQAVIVQPPGDKNENLGNLSNIK